MAIQLVGNTQDAQKLLKEVKAMRMLNGVSNCIYVPELIDVIITSPPTHLFLIQEFVDTNIEKILESETIDLSE